MNLKWKRNVGLCLEKTLSKIFRPFLSQVVSKKRISQLFFEKLVGEIRSKYQTQSITYVSSDLLGAYLARKSKFPLVVVSGGTDHDITQAEYESMLATSTTRFYVQNLAFPEAENISFLPIGVEDFKWGRNGMPWNFWMKSDFTAKKKLVLVGPFGRTHASRAACIDESRASNMAELLIERMPSWQYASVASTFLFIACPRGNGLDTHRFWETLYRKSIPVVIRDHHSENLAKYSLPHVAISDWAHLHDFRIKDFEKISKEIPANSLLSQKWWRERFLKDLGLE